MIELLARSLLISFYPQIFVHATIFVLLIGFIYGYAVSFIFGIKKTIIIGFFVIVVTVLLVLLFSSSYLFYIQFISENSSGNTLTLTNFLSTLSSSLMLLLSHLFINLCLGHVGLLLGILFYFPSEWYLRKHSLLTNLRESAEEYGKITDTQQRITQGTISLPGMYQGKVPIKESSSEFKK